MCVCTPAIKTPWCGKPGCEMPKQNRPLRYAQHLSGQGRMWPTYDQDGDAPDWQVFEYVDKAMRVFFVPKSEYHLCAPPHWRDVSSECVVDPDETTIYLNGRPIGGSLRDDIRVRQVRGDQIPPVAFVFEQK